MENSKPKGPRPKFGPRRKPGPRRPNRKPKKIGAIKKEVIQLDTKLKKVRREVNQPSSRMNHYLSMLLSPRHELPVRMPLLSTGRSFIKQVNYRVAIPIPSGKGFFALAFKNLSSFTSGSTASPFVTITNANYLPSGGNVTAAWVNIPNYTPSLVDTNGTNVTIDHFSNSTVISGHVEATLTGVSNLNKAGKVYIAEARTNYWHAGTATSFVTARSLADTYAIPNLIKHYNHKELQIMNMGAKNQIDYTYIPEEGYATMNEMIPAAQTAEVNYTNDQKIFIMIVDGAATTTIVEFVIGIVLQMRPNSQYLDTYPTAFSTCFENPDKYLREIETNKDLILSVDKADDHGQKLAPLAQIFKGGYRDRDGVVYPKGYRP